MKEKILYRLISVKSFVTLTLTAVFSVLALRGVVNAEQFMTVFTTIVAFYFGVQTMKDRSDPDA